MGVGSRRLGISLVATGVVVLVGLMGWRHRLGPPPPPVELAGLDPYVPRFAFGHDVDVLSASPDGDTVFVVPRGLLPTPVEAPIQLSAMEVFVDQGVVLARDIASGQRMRLSADGALCSRVALSPARSELAWFQEGDGGLDLVAAPLPGVEGAPEVLATGLTTARAPQWIPGSNELVAEHPHGLAIVARSDARRVVRQPCRDPLVFGSVVDPMVACVEGAGPDARLVVRALGAHGLQDLGTPKDASPDPPPPGAEAVAILGHGRRARGQRIALSADGRYLVARMRSGPSRESVWVDFAASPPEVWKERESGWDTVAWHPRRPLLLALHRSRGRIEVREPRSVGSLLWEGDLGKLPSGTWIGQTDRITVATDGRSLEMDLNGNVEDSGREPSRELTSTLGGELAWRRENSIHTAMGTWAAAPSLGGALHRRPRWSASGRFLAWDFRARFDVGLLPDLVVAEEPGAGVTVLRGVQDAVWLPARDALLATAGGQLFFVVPGEAPRPLPVEGEAAYVAVGGDRVVVSTGRQKLEVGTLDGDSIAWEPDTLPVPRIRSRVR